MAMFNASKYRKSGAPMNRPSRKDIFSLSGGRTYHKRLNRRINRLPLSNLQKEYVKQVMSKYDRPGSTGITREEFHKGLDEMAKNVRDNVTRKEIERIKKHI